MIGLCETCLHSKTIKGAHTTFWMCLRSQTDPSFPRYPRLPVLQCRGYEARGPAEDLGERFGDPGEPDSGEAPSSGASASVDS